MDTRFIFITGGVVSSLGKGVIASTLGRLLINRGYRVTIQKFDPYINVDPGTLNPNEHGECFVTPDGYECDLDLGHYERFTGIRTSRWNSFTTGRIYQEVINRERRGEYDGHTVQVVPHISDAIKQNMLRTSKENNLDFVITEIGGTVGDIESLPFLEAIRQLRWELGKRALIVHLAYVPYIAAAGELKTKPTQHSVKQLQSYGIQPDCLVLRSEYPLNDGLRNKVAGFCNVLPKYVLHSPDVKSIYELPVKMHEEGLDNVILDLCGVAINEKPGFTDEHERWLDFLHKRSAACKEVNIGFVGKYDLQDAYKSITESLLIAGAYCGAKVKCNFIDCEQLTAANVHEHLANQDAFIICPGFGSRGIEGKVVAAQYLREHNLPTLGICLGMQVMTIEYARNVLGLADANSTEFAPNTPAPVIDMMEEQKNQKMLGGTMRLGEYECELRPNTLASRLYGHDNIFERHRHRYELNNEYAEKLAQAGFVISGHNPKTNLAEIIEIPSCNFYIGVQFHPEYSSSVLKPHPLFMALVTEALEGNSTGL